MTSGAASPSPDDDDVILDGGMCALFVLGPFHCCA